LIGYALIAGGAPSSVSAMTNHLMNLTIGQEEARLAIYYQKGAVDDPMVELAHQVADGDLAFSEALDELMVTYVRTGGDLDLVDQAETRLGKRLGDLAFRIQEGLENAPVAVVRPNLHPMVAQGLGIERDAILTRDEISALLAGRRADGETIEGKYYAKERTLPVDPKTGEIRHSTPIGSVDFCPTPDKSVSVAWAFAPPEERARIYNAHIEAAREAVGYIAERVGQARLGKGGEEGAEPGHVAWLEFTHHTARRTHIAVDKGEVSIKPEAGAPGDPDLHTHCLIPNAVFCESGRVGSLDTAQLRGFIFEADSFYQALIGQKLRDAGFAIGLDHRTGAARMVAIPDEVRTLFSKRTNAGELLARKAASERGEHWDMLSDEQRETRIKNATQSWEQKARGGKDDVADFADWHRQAQEIGWQVPQSLQLIGPVPLELTPEQRIRQAYEIALPHLADRLEHEAVLSHFVPRTMAGWGLVETGIKGRKDFDAVTRLMRAEGVEQYGERTALAWGIEENKRSVSVTTMLHEADEADFIRLAQAAAADRRGSIPGELLQQTIAASRLDVSGQHGEAQRRAIEHLAAGRFALVIGSAGSGKTTLLKPLVAAWQAQGREVHGASLAWRQADELADAGIDRRNVKAFSVLVDSARDGRLNLTQHSVVAIDEWGLLGTRQGLELLRLREKHGFTIVALGDDKQCASVEAGAIIDLSRRALGAEQVPQILTTVRQQTERERVIAGLFREGRAAEALAMKRSDGTAELVPGGYVGVTHRVAKLYRERLEATGEAPTISAPTNIDAHRISEAVRAERRLLSQLGPDLMRVQATDGERDYTLSLAVGDQVRLFKSTGAKFESGTFGSIGRNGSVLEVVATNRQGLMLKAKTGRVGTVAWETLTEKRTGWIQLAYGDAMTIHTAQGSTAKEHIFALPAGSQAVDGRLGYTANTRHRQAAWLITSETAEHGAVRQRRPLNDAHPVTVDDKWANVARALAWQPARDTATALRERIGELQRGSVRWFQSVAPRVDRAQSTRAPEAPAIRQRLRLEQISVGMRQAVEAVKHRLQDWIPKPQIQRQDVPRQEALPHRGPSLRL
jgi:TrwC relaxase/AAA domain